MKAKLDKLDKLSKLLSSQETINGIFLSLFGHYGLGHLQPHLCLEKRCGVSSIQFILSLSLFHINGESIYSLYTKHFYNLLRIARSVIIVC